jgi:hypothetical protein
MLGACEIIALPRAKPLTWVKRPCGIMPLQNRTDSGGRAATLPPVAAQGGFVY